ncbi:MAG: flagellar biosynthesis protein FliQ [Actinomycetia bacterium]|nr:flagellar biosynthesis protein FliQ [Actinomycetes bacterium]MCP4223864.1 flagellar biosynthesis protein FliQ [Actinomycetes bacterium]MCP5035306.1 flagellar biosynthesis protein FliQ [Actinomycetes bacterium]
MSEADIIDIVKAALWTASQVSAPILLTAIGVGVFMGLLQSITQIQEQTLAFVPKFAAVGLVLALFGHWMLRQMVDFTISLFERIPTML